MDDNHKPQGTDQTKSVLPEGPDQVNNNNVCISAENNQVVVRSGQDDIDQHGDDCISEKQVPSEIKK